MIEAEGGVMLPQAKEYLEPPETGRGEDGSSPQAFSGSVVLPAHILTLDCWPREL